MSIDFLGWLSGHVVELTCVIAWLMILLPAVYYLFTTWAHRRSKLFARLGPSAIRMYYRQFFPALAITHEKSADKTIQASFEQHFASLYGRKHYVLPLLLLALISGIGLLATAESIGVWLERKTTARFPPIVISAFLGAYAWVLFDQIQRFRAQDFTVHDVYVCIFRFLIAIPIAISFAAILKEDVGVPVAFFLAAFPTQALFTMGRRIATSKLGLGEVEEAGPTELEQLQSIGRTNAERYQDEGIKTIAELAWADPVSLTIKTNREFSFIIDSISQALLWVYFETKVKQLYPLSLRGAQEVCSLMQSLSSDDPEERAGAEATLKAAAAVLGLQEDVFRQTLLQVTDDPYSQFLFRIWE